jgi:ribonuclease-3
MHGNQAIRDEVVGTEGADHERLYEVAVFLLDRRIGSGRGTSKKLAEEDAAKNALATLASEATGP